MDTELLSQWRSLVNVTAGELRRFLAEYGDEAGLSRAEAAAQGVRSGRDSARALLRMLERPAEQWSPSDWEWARRQVGFLRRMRGVRGPLRDAEGRPTRKLLALLLWGHNPEKKTMRPNADNEVDLYVVDGVAFPYGRHEFWGRALYELLTAKHRDAFVLPDDVPNVSGPHPGWVIQNVRGPHGGVIAPDSATFSGETFSIGERGGVVSLRTTVSKDSDGYANLVDWEIDHSDPENERRHRDAQRGIVDALLARAGSQPSPGESLQYQEGWKAGMEHRREHAPRGQRYAPPLLRQGRDGRMQRRNGTEWFDIQAGHAGAAPMGALAQEVADVLANVLGRDRSRLRVDYNYPQCEDEQVFFEPARPQRVDRLATVTREPTGEGYIVHTGYDAIEEDFEESAVATIEEAVRAAGAWVLRGRRPDDVGDLRANQWGDEAITPLGRRVRSILGALSREDVQVRAEGEDLVILDVPESGREVPYVAINGPLRGPFDVEYGRSEYRHTHQGMERTDLPVRMTPSERTREMFLDSAVERAIRWLDAERQRRPQLGLRLNPEAPRHNHFSDFVGEVEALCQRAGFRCGEAREVTDGAGTQGVDFDGEVRLIHTPEHDFAVCVRSGDQWQIHKRTGDLNHALAEVFEQLGGARLSAGAPRKNSLRPTATGERPADFEPSVVEMFLQHGYGGVAVESPDEATVIVVAGPGMIPSAGAIRRLGSRYQVTLYSHDDLGTIYEGADLEEGILELGRAFEEGLRQNGQCRRPGLRTSDYLLPDERKYPAPDKHCAIVALTYATWPNNRPDAARVVDAVRRSRFARDPDVLAALERAEERL